MNINQGNLQIFTQAHNSNTFGLWSVIIALPAINLFQSGLSAYPPQSVLAERMWEL